MCRHLRALLAAVAVMMVGCGPAPTTPTPVRTPTPRPTPTPTPDPDLNEHINVGATGVGVYQLVTVPVATLHNASTQHAALGVVVHFTPRRDGRALDPVESASVNLPPEATLVVTANCTDTCTGANHTDVVVAVTAWGDPANAGVISATGVAFQRGGGGGSGFGSVTGTLASTAIPAGASITVFAACTVGGVIIGGGYTQDTWAAPATPQPATVSVIVSTAPDHCDLYAAVAG